MFWEKGWDLGYNSMEQGLMQAVFDSGIPILGTLIWACPNLILSKTKKLQLYAVPVFRSNQQHNVDIMARK